LVFRLLAVLSLFIKPTDSKIQVIGTGTGRTGSTTLHEALSILGNIYAFKLFKYCSTFVSSLMSCTKPSTIGFKTYHMKEILIGGPQRHPELDFWFDAFSTNCSHPEQLKDILETNGYNATVHAINFPCHDSLLFDLYPEAKVIHTERSSAELWHDSVSNSVCKISSDSLMLRVLGLLFPVFRKFKRFQPLLMGRAMFGSYEPVENVSKEYCLEHKEQMIGFYNAHNARIKEIVPEERLLVISNHMDGWNAICSFLGVPVPDVPFPHVNKRESMTKTILTAMANKYDNFSYSVRAMVILVGCFLCFVLLKFVIWFGRKVTGKCKGAEKKSKRSKAD